MLRGKTCARKSQYTFFLSLLTGSYQPVVVRSQLPARSYHSLYRSSLHLTTMWRSVVRTDDSIVWVKSNLKYQQKEMCYHLMPDVHQC